jgi:hypothetical protein
MMSEACHVLEPTAHRTPQIVILKVTMLTWRLLTSLKARMIFVAEWGEWGDLHALTLHQGHPSASFFNKTLRHLQRFLWSLHGRMISQHFKAISLLGQYIRPQFEL